MKWTQEVYEDRCCHLGDMYENKYEKVLDKAKKYCTILSEGYPSKNSNEDFVDRLLS
jgi:hypothetical protein